MRILAETNGDDLLKKRSLYFEIWLTIGYWNQSLRKASRKPLKIYLSIEAAILINKTGFANRKSYF